MKFASLLRKLIFIGSSIFALTLPFDFSLKNINLDIPLVKSLLTLEIVILLLLWELLIICERHLKIKTGGLLLPLFVFFAIHLFSAVFPSNRMIWSLKYTFRFFGLSLIYLILINFITDKRRLTKIINCLLISAGLAAGLVIIQYCFPYALIEWQNFFDDAVVGIQRIRGLFGWPTNMGVYLGSSLPLIFSCLIYKPNRYFERFIYGFLILIIIMALIFSKTRGWILGLFFGLSTFWFLYLIKEREYAFVWWTIILLILVMVICWSSAIDKFIMEDLELSEKARWGFFKAALRLVKEHPFKGMGADMFYWQFDSHYRTHNIFLETLVNLGVFGLWALLWFFYKIFKTVSRGLTQISTEDSYIQIGVLSSLISFLMHNQVDYFWNIHEIIGLFWFLAGMGICASSLNERIRMVIPLES